MMNWSYYVHIKVNQEMAISRFDLENVTSVCGKNWFLNTQSAVADTYVKTEIEI